MKSKIIILITLFIGVLVSVSAQSKLYDKFSDVDNITSVYLSKTLLRMGSNIDGLDIKNVANDLDCLIVLSSETKEGMARLKSETTSISKAKGYEELMRVRDGGDNVSFYIKVKGDSVNELIMFVEEPDEFVIIQLTGRIQLEDLQGIIK